MGAKAKSANERSFAAGTEPEAEPESAPSDDRQEMPHSSRHKRNLIKPQQQETYISI